MVLTNGGCASKSLAPAAAVSNSDGYRDPPSVRSVDFRDPAADARIAISSHDFRVMATTGLGVSAPGVPDEIFPEYVKRFGLKYIVGTPTTRSSR